MTNQSYGPSRHDRLVEERVHDPYRSAEKLPEPTVCPDCQAVYHHGRWEWSTPPEDAEPTLCPACRRTRDRVPAGFLTLSGEFFTAHREEIFQLIQNTEEQEKAEHPLQRIMGIESSAGECVITFTDPHITRGTAEALQHAYKGELQLNYQAAEFMLRASWHR